MTISGAYGRDYKSLKAAQTDWDSNLDFQIRDLFHGGGTYINKTDAVNHNTGTIMVRYNQDRKIGPLK